MGFVGLAVGVGCGYDGGLSWLELWWQWLVVASGDVVFLFLFLYVCVCGCHNRGVAMVGCKRIL